MAGRGLLTVGLLAATASATVYFKENFDDKWESRWVVPINWKTAEEMGEWAHTAGDWFGDAKDKGIKTTEDARFYGLSAKLAKPFSNEGKDLVLQYVVKHEQRLDCGGAYIKLLGPKLDQASFGGDTPYQIMFGPDICGSTQRTHVIFNYPQAKAEEKNLLIEQDVPTRTDQLSHLYTLHLIAANNSFNVLIDGESVRAGALEGAWNFSPPKTILDPAQSKPADWVDEAMMVDPEDVKPAGWDDIPATVPDAEAAQPEDWDEEEDGTWEAPMVDNPEYMGPWTPKMVANPAYKGAWEHPHIANPEYFEDPKLHARAKEVTAVGFELWQVKSGTMFDDIILTDSLEEANAYAKDTFWAKKEGEKAMLDAAEALRVEKEKAEREKMMKNAEANGEDMGEEDGEGMFSASDIDITEVDEDDEDWEEDEDGEDAEETTFTDEL